MYTTHACAGQAYSLQHQGSGWATHTTWIVCGNTQQKSFPSHGPHGPQTPKYVSRCRRAPESAEYALGQHAFMAVHTLSTASSRLAPNQTVQHVCFEPRLVQYVDTALRHEQPPHHGNKHPYKPSQTWGLCHQHPAKPARSSLQHSLDFSTFKHHHTVSCPHSKAAQTSKTWPLHVRTTVRPWCTFES